MSIGNLGNIGNGFFNGWGPGAGSSETKRGKFQDSQIPLNTSQPTNSVVKPSVVDYSHFSSDQGRTHVDATWDEAPIYNTGVIIVNCGKGLLNMVGNGVKALNPFNW
ncbi:MAG: hypothetical protein K2X66_05970 [Cyanobacteria bacterium]|nr:hypothetical protein [Cyanobacteriota bacterium]